ncbi:hypothetical protein COSO111634_05015 [Corallococcus soli]
MRRASARSRTGQGAACRSLASSMGASRSCSCACWARYVLRRWSTSSSRVSPPAGKASSAGSVASSARSRASTVRSPSADSSRTARSSSRAASFCATSSAWPSAMRPVSRSRVEKYSAGRSPASRSACCTSSRSFITLFSSGFCPRGAYSPSASLRRRSSASGSRRAPCMPAANSASDTPRCCASRWKEDSSSRRKANTSKNRSRGTSASACSSSVCGSSCPSGVRTVSVPSDARLPTRRRTTSGPAAVSSSSSPPKSAPSGS